jgi:hypothetical protein
VTAERVNRKPIIADLSAFRIPLFRPPPCAAACFFPGPDTQRTEISPPFFAVCAVDRDFQPANVSERNTKKQSNSKTDADFSVCDISPIRRVKCILASLILLLRTSPHPTWRSNGESPSTIPLQRNYRPTPRSSSGASTASYAAKSDRLHELLRDRVIARW